MKESVYKPVTVQPKQKTPRKPAKPVGSSLTFLGPMETGISYMCGREYWEIRANGELLITKDKHTFVCTWRMDGTLWSYLYPSMGKDEAIFKVMLSDQRVRQYIANHTKRVVPNEWAIEEVCEWTFE